MKLDELVNHFIIRDSESNIQIGSSIMNDISGFTQQSSMIANEQGTTAPNKPLAYP